MRSHDAGGRGETGERTWTRRKLLGFGLGGVAALGVAGVTGAELVSRGILPGQTALDDFDGACSVPAPHR